MNWEDAAKKILLAILVFVIVFTCLMSWSNMFARPM